MKDQIAYLRLLLFVSILLITSACDSKKNTENIDYPAQENGIQLTISEKNDGGKGSASGPHRIDYKNYKTSEVLEKLSDLPVVYEANEDPLLKLDYYFPDKDLASAQKECIDTILKMLDLRSDTIEQEREVLIMQIENTPPDDIQANSSGVKIAQNNDEVKMYEVSAEEIRQFLKEKLNRIIFLKEDYCCLNVKFNIGTSLEVMKADLKKSGIELAKEKRIVRILKVYQR